LQGPAQQRPHGHHAHAAGAVDEPVVLVSATGDSLHPPAPWFTSQGAEMGRCDVMSQVRGQQRPHGHHAHGAGVDDGGPLLVSATGDSLHPPAPWFTSQGVEVGRCDAMSQVRVQQRPHGHHAHGARVDDGGPVLVSATGTLPHPPAPGFTSQGAEVGRCDAMLQASVQQLGAVRRSRQCGHRRHVVQWRLRLLQWRFLRQ
jgi:hypothetical protein